MKNTMSGRIGRFAALSLAAGVTVGCSHSDKPRPLQAGSFYTPDQPRGVVGDPSTEQNRQNATGEVRIPARPKEPPPVPANQIRQDPPAPVVPQHPSTRPAAAQPGASSGQYQLMGAVVATVSGQPIYANKVLALIDKPLKAKARTLTREQFREFAIGLIQQQLGELVNDELLYAAAIKGLSDDDQKIADQATQGWRNQQVTLAGGSIEVARGKAAAEGEDFDELMRQQYRRTMIDYYRHKKLFPRIQVSADDLRKYYNRHLEEEFSSQEAVRFRLLGVSVKASGTRDAAVTKLNGKLERARAGEDFATMCSKENDEALLAAKSGDLGWKARGGLPPALKKVEEAVWSLKPGELSGIIDLGDTLYVVKLEEARKGGVRPFNEQSRADGKPTVQEEIRSKLQREQFRALSIEIEAKLRGEALVETNNEMMTLVLDMAMQRYTSWVAMAQ